MEQMMMLKVLLATTFAIGLAVAPAAHAQQSIVPSPSVQGQGTVKGSGGATVTAPGTRVQGESSTSGTVGASGSAPNHLGGGAESGTSVRGGGAAVGGGVKANGNLNTR